MGDTDFLQKADKRLLRTGFEIAAEGGGYPFCDGCHLVQRDFAVIICHEEVINIVEPSCIFYGHGIVVMLAGQEFVIAGVGKQIDGFQEK